MAVNQVRFNGDDLINLRQDSVDEEKLTKGDTAHKKSGVGIEGKADYYAVKDEEADISGEDYIPFYDVSEKKKRKSLFSSFISKIKDILNDSIPYGGYAVATISGSSVTANINNFSLKNGAMVMIRVENKLPVNATLNISNTGAKPIWYYRNNSVRGGDSIGLLTGVHYITLMYDSVNDVYHVVSFDISSSVTAQNYVADTSGNVVNNAFFGNNGFQLKHKIDNGALMYNYYKNGTWRGDKRLIEQDQSLIYTGVKIPANSNFNDYGSIGIYYVNNKADADTMTNIPEKKSGKLIVMALADTSSWNMQIYVTNNADSIYRRRQANAGNWLSWVRVANDSELITHYGQEIPDNADLNNYNTEGVYNITSNNRANTILNIPTKLAGKLTVMRIAGSSYATQFYITYALNNSPNSFTVSQSYNIFYRSYDNYNGANKWTGWRQLTLDRDLSALMTATGKNLLPSWSYSGHSITDNGITYTFNPATGEITANGTATADSACRLAGATLNPYDLPAGEYILSGCPSGGSSSTYMLDLQVKFSNKDGETAFYDYGNSIKVKLDDYAGSYTTQNYFIRIVKGTTVNNKVFKPMLRPAFSNDTYRPNDSFYKGNLYIGSCETAGDVKDKVASVDGYFKLRKGVPVCVKFKNSNTYNATSDNKVTLNVNGTGAYNIYYNNGNPTGTNRTAFGYSNRYVTYVFDGGSWVFQSHSCDDNATYTPQSLGSGYGTCSTPNSTSEKAVSLSGYNLVNGGYVSVRFTNAVSANAKMNINSRGAKPIYYNNSAIGNNIILAGCTALFVYDGTRYHLLSTDYASTSQMYYIQRDQVVWSSVLGNNYNTDSWSCNIQRQGRIVIGSLEIATRQGANTITFPSYSQTTDKVFIHFPSIPLAGYYECIVTVGATTYPAFISVESTMGTVIILRTNLTITNNSNIKVTFFAFLR